jgi:hypothetical protein
MFSFHFLGKIAVSVGTTKEHSGPERPARLCLSPWAVPIHSTEVSRRSPPPTSSHLSANKKMPFQVAANSPGCAAGSPVSMWQRLSVKRKSFGTIAKQKAFSRARPQLKRRLFNWQASCAGCIWNAGSLRPPIGTLIETLRHHRVRFGCNENQPAMKSIPHRGLLITIIRTCLS